MFEQPWYPHLSKIKRPGLVFEAVHVIQRTLSHQARRPEAFLRNYSWVLCFDKKKKKRIHTSGKSCKQFVVLTEDNARFPISSFSSHSIPLSQPVGPLISQASHPSFCYQMLCDLGTVWEPPHSSML